MGSPETDSAAAAGAGTTSIRPPTAASELIEEGAPLTVDQRQLRHRDARTTLQKYGHVVGDTQR